VKKDEYIGYGDVILPIIDLAWHMGVSEYFNPFSEYVWDSWTLGMTLEGVDYLAVDGLSPGADCAINCHLALVNTDRGDFQYHDQVGGHRATSPSAGSMTPYHNGTTYAKVDIGAGNELFKYYGDNWFIQRTDVFGLIPMKKDYPKAERLLKKLRHLEDNLGLSEQMRHNLYSFIIHEFPRSRTMNALPRHYKEVSTIVEKSMRTYHQANATRSLEELQATGRCFDNIQPKESTLPYAGRGAFATRHLHKNSIVTGSPLLHVPSDKLAYMYDQDPEGNRNTSSFAGFALWYNYCMGHRSSSILLCPYGSGINYINHNQTLANIKLQWPPHGQISHNETWFKRPSMDADYEYTTHLGMDYVATRDIEKGEELFMDYGHDWEQAWQDHVKKWEPSEDDRAYISATQWNRENEAFELWDQTTTMARQQQQQVPPLPPYPPNLLMRCDEEIFEEDQSWYYRNNNKERSRKVWPSWDKGHECKILERTQEEDGTVTYTVEVTNTKGKKVIREGVPRDLIAMVDAPYTTDWHMRSAFRHYIGIPDEMVPEAWMDKLDKTV
jgi:SET domain